MQKGIIENLGQEAQEKIIELSAGGLSASAVCEIINSDFNTEINKQNVNLFLKRSDKFLYAKSENQDKLADQYFNTIKQLNETNRVICDLFFKLSKDPEEVYKNVVCPECDHEHKIKLKNYENMIKLSRVILDQIKHTDRLLHRTGNEKQSLRFEVNFVNLSKKLQIFFPTMLEKMKNQGIIPSYNKKKFSQYN